MNKIKYEFKRKTKWNTANSVDSIHQRELDSEPFETIQIAK